MTGKSNMLDFLGSVQRFIKLNDKENFLDSHAAGMAPVGKAECRINRLFFYVERYTVCWKTGERNSTVLTLFSGTESCRERIIIIPNVMLRSLCPHPTTIG